MSGREETKQTYLREEGREIVPQCVFAKKGGRDVGMVAPFMKQNSTSEENNPALGNASTPAGLTWKQHLTKVNRGESNWFMLIL